MMNHIRQYGKKWCVEYDSVWTGIGCRFTAWITNRQSAATVEVHHIGPNGILASSWPAWFLVPAYLQRIISRRLFTDAARRIKHAV